MSVIEKMRKRNITLLPQSDLMMIIHGFGNIGLLRHQFPVPTSDVGVAGALFYETLQRHTTEFLGKVEGKVVTVTIENSSNEVVGRFHAKLHRATSTHANLHCDDALSIPVTIEWGDRAILANESVAWVTLQGLPEKSARYFVRTGAHEIRDVVVEGDKAYQLFADGQRAETSFCGAEWMEDLTMHEVTL